MALETSRQEMAQHGESYPGCIDGRRGPEQRGGYRMKAFLLFGSLLLALLFIPSASAAVAWFEDFEDDTIGQLPTGDYTFTQGTSAGESPTSTTAGVDGRGLNGTDQSYGMYCEGDKGCHSTWEWDENKIDYVEFFFTVYDTWWTFEASETHFRICGKVIDSGSARVCNDDILTTLKLGFDYFNNEYQISVAPEGSQGLKWLVQNEPVGNQHHLRIEYDWVNMTQEFFWDEVSVHDTGMVDSAAVFGSAFSFYSNSNDADSSPDLVIDNLTVGSSVTTPEPVQSLRATVTSPASASDNAEVVLKFPVSANDPNQTHGEWTYEVLVNGLDLGFDDPVTIDDGAGFRVYLDNNLGGATIGDTVFQIRVDGGEGKVSTLSCSVVVNLNEQFATDSCGTNPPGPPGTIGDGGFLPGVDLDQTATDLGLDTGAFGWIIGAAITFGIAAAAYGGTQSPLLAGAGALFGVGISTAFGLFPLWLILVLVLFGAAGVFLMRR